MNPLRVIIVGYDMATATKARAARLASAHEEGP
ncbi:hypothetical protein FHS44_002796 [Streptosporangium saharense]|uniref:Uncharacterized protein n=1 Tax=Streptosporangium saharense TaxID=1706840 RepID=A0A7W7QLD3_9ACTN|nr:hypothetical protein [Streptosporangium saharense]